MSTLVRIYREPTESGRDHKLVTEDNVNGRKRYPIQWPEPVPDGSDASEDGENPTDPDTGNYAVKDGAWFTLYGPDGEALDYKKVREKDLEAAFAELRG